MCYHAASRIMFCVSRFTLYASPEVIMKDVLPAIEQWRERGERVAVATVVKTLGSAPRGVGAKMVVSDGGSMAGSVSGGCIEGAVFDACQEALRTGKARLLHFGVADDDAWDVGLACGGMIDVFVEPLDW
jgi:xanthine/CO dehydrogenase XdhC/CoxF family maturation factor